MTDLNNEKKPRKTKCKELEDFVQAYAIWYQEHYGNPQPQDSGSNPPPPPPPPPGYPKP